MDVLQEEFCFWELQINQWIWKSEEILLQLISVAELYYF